LYALAISSITLKEPSVGGGLIATVIDTGPFLAGAVPSEDPLANTSAAERKPAATKNAIRFINPS
jgi:hypothetical protein